MPSRTVREIILPSTSARPRQSPTKSSRCGVGQAKCADGKWPRLSSRASPLAAAAQRIAIASPPRGPSSRQPIITKITSNAVSGACKPPSNQARCVVSAIKPSRKPQLARVVRPCRLQARAARPSPHMSAAVAPRKLREFGCCNTNAISAMVHTHSTNRAIFQKVWARWVCSSVARIGGANQLRVPARAAVELASFGMTGGQWGEQSFRQKAGVPTRLKFPRCR